MTFAFCKYKKWAYYCGMENAANKIEMKISRVDIINKRDIGYFTLPSLNNTADINDVNEIDKISILGNIDQLFDKMPKSHNWKKGTMINGQNAQSFMSIEFNTFWMNDSTGNTNESAIKRRIKVIQKLKSLGL